MCCCQALDFVRPLRTSEKLEKLHEYVRKFMPFISEDEIFSDYIEKLAQEIRLGNIIKSVL